MNIEKKDSQKVCFRKKVGLIIAGVFLGLAILEIFLRICGLIFVSSQEFSNRRSMKQKDTYKIVCLGESTTAFFRTEPYPPLLEEILNNANVGTRFSVINKGAVSAGTPDIMYGLKDNLDLYKPDMVIVMMGINDCGYLSYKVIPSFGPEFFLGHLRTYNFFKLIWQGFINRLKEIKKSQSLKQGSRIFPEQLRKYVMEKNRLNGISPSEKNQLVAGENNSFVQQGVGYLERGDVSRAEDCFKRAIISSPKDSRAYRNLGWLYIGQGRHEEAEIKFREAIQLSPGVSESHFGLGLACKGQNKSRFPEVEVAFKKAIELNPANYSVYRELGNTYILQGKYQQAADLFKEFRIRNPRNVQIYQDLVQLNEAQGQSDKAAALGQDCFRRVTVKNYLRMKEILDERKIKLVCVQYPMREAAPLREIFKDKKGIVFVDNEKVFKDAVNNSNYSEYFIDRMFYDFGHCTKKGNWLLAKNIAGVILKEVFSK